MDSWKLNIPIDAKGNHPSHFSEKQKGGVFVVRSYAKRNAIPINRRHFSTDWSTIAIVVSGDDVSMWSLVNEPGTLYTTNSDWRRIPLGSTIVGGLQFKGFWNPDNVSENTIFDNDAVNPGEFYVVTGASDPSESVQIQGLFGGLVTVVHNGDFIIYEGGTSPKYRVQSIGYGITWTTLQGIPNVIKEYEQGVVQYHTQSISSISGLQELLNSKFDSDDVASIIDGVEGPDGKLINLLFLKNFFYTKEQITNLLLDVEIDPNTLDFYSKATIDAKDAQILQASKDYADATFTTPSQTKTLIEQFLSVSVLGISGEFEGGIAERDAADTIGNNENWIVPEIGQDGVLRRNVYNFTGQLGQSGSQYWRYVFVLDNATGGGHVIVDESDNLLTQRSKLKFEGFDVQDDSANSQTLIRSTSLGGVVSGIFDGFETSIVVDGIVSVSLLIIDGMPQREGVDYNVSVANETTTYTLVGPASDFTDMPYTLLYLKAAGSALNLTEPISQQAFDGQNINLSKRAGVFYSNFNINENIVFSFPSVIEGGRALLEITGDGIHSISWGSEVKHAFGISNNSIINGTKILSFQYVNSGVIIDCPGASDGVYTVQDHPTEPNTIQVLIDGVVKFEINLSNA